MRPRAFVIALSPTSAMMNRVIAERSIELTRSLIAPIQLEYDPLASVDHVLTTVVYAGAVNPEDYRAAIEHALTSRIQLAKLLPEYHPEAILRRYLAELKRRLSSIN